MKKLFTYVILILLLLVGCKNSDSENLEDSKSHNQDVIEANSIVGQSYTNDKVGLEITLREDFEITDYENLNLDSKFFEVSNMLLYAAISGSEVVSIIETLYVEEKWNNIMNGIKDDLDELPGADYEISYELIDGEESTAIKVSHDMGEGRIFKYNYYYLHHNDSIITIMISYDSENYNDLPEDIISWIKLD